VVAGGAALYISADSGSTVVAQDAAPLAGVVIGRIEETVSATGSVTSGREARLVPAISGRVIEVTVAEGQQVAEGDVLLTLDAGSLENQVARAEASLATAKARLEQAKLPASEAEIAQAQARLDQAKRSATEAEIAAAQASVDSAQANLDKLLAGATAYDLESAKLSVDSARNQLWSAQANRDATNGSRGASGAQKDQAEAQVLIAEVAVQQALVAQTRLQAPPRDEDIAAARAQVSQAEAQLAQTLERPKAEELALAQAQLDQTLERPRAEDVLTVQAQVDEAMLSLTQARDSLADATLVAPFAGTVVNITVNEGEWAMAGSPVVHLVDTDALKLQIILDEADVAQVAEGQAAYIDLDAFPKQKVRGTVESVASAATQTSGGVAYEVDTAIETDGLPIRLGMTARVDIVTRSVEDALLLPNRAIEADREAAKYYVTRKTALGSERIEVTIGLRDDDHTQVVSGLREGEQVLLQTVASQDSEQGPGGMFRAMPPGGRR
jgi:HlyD family secretion protein